MDEVKVTGKVDVNGDGATRLLSAIAIGIAVIGLLAVFGYSNTSRDIARNAEDSVNRFEQVRLQARTDTCTAFGRLFRAERLRIVEGEKQLRMGPFSRLLNLDDEQRLLIYRNNKRRYTRQYGNRALPEYCAKHEEPTPKYPLKAP